MEDVKKSVEKTRSEVNSFVEEILFMNTWDMIVPILRKGRLILLSTMQDFSEKIRSVPFHGVDDMNELTILILDDKALHGHTMKSKFEEVLLAGAKKENVKTAVFVKNRECDFPIDCFRYELADLDYDNKESDLGQFYESLCLQLDADHLVARGLVAGDSFDHEIWQRFPAAIKESATGIGIFYPQDSIAELWGRQKFCIADVPLSKCDLGNLGGLLTEGPGVQKMRFCLEPCGELLIMPIFYPMIDPNKCECGKALEGKTKFCEELKDIPRTDQFCRECVDFNLQMSVMRSLLPIIFERTKKAGFAVKIDSLSWPQLEYVCPHFKAILEQKTQELRKL